MIVTLEDVRRARAAIRDAIVDTPFLRSRTLSAILGAQLHLKFENHQFTASFKERGALNKLLSLSAQERARGVVAASAGNHAQGVAFHAARLGVQAVIVMPETAPRVKIEAVRAFGAEIVLHGRAFADAVAHVPSLIEARGLVLVHPFDDPLVIAGQGTVALDMMEVADLDVLLAPVGGGGLIAGVATAAKALRPDIEVIGVQTELFPAMAVAAGRLAGPPPRGGASVAEGIAVETPGRAPIAIVRDLVDDVLVVRERAIEDAIAMLLEIEKTLCEGAGAVGVAALMEHPQRFAGKRVGAILSGGNVDINVLSASLQRALMRRGRIVRLVVTTLDAAGALAAIARVIAECGGNIRQVDHDRIFTSQGAKSATIQFEIEVADPAAAATICARLGEMDMIATRSSPT